MFKKHTLLLMCIASLSASAGAQEAIEDLVYQSDFEKAMPHGSLFVEAEFKLEVLELAPFKYEFRIFVKETGGMLSDSNPFGCGHLQFSINGLEEGSESFTRVPTDGEIKIFTVVHELQPHKSMSVKVILCFPGKRGTGTFTFSPFQ